MLHKEYGYSYTHPPLITNLTQREIDRLLMAAQIDSYMKEQYRKHQQQQATGAKTQLSKGDKIALKRAEEKIERDGTVLSG